MPFPTPIRIAALVSNLSPLEREQLLASLPTPTFDELSTLMPRVRLQRGRRHKKSTFTPAPSWRDAPPPAREAPLAAFPITDLIDFVRATGRLATLEATGRTSKDPNHYKLWEDSFSQSHLLASRLLLHPAFQIPPQPDPVAPVRSPVDILTRVQPQHERWEEVPKADDSVAALEKEFSARLPGGKSNGPAPAASTPAAEVTGTATIPPHGATPYSVKDGRVKSGTREGGLARAVACLWRAAHDQDRQEFLCDLTDRELAGLLSLARVVADARLQGGA